MDETPGKQLNFDEQVELFVSASYKAWSLRPHDKRTKNPWKRPSRRSIQRYVKRFKLKPCKASVQTVSRYESVRDHRNFISLFCALEGLREMFGYPDDKQDWSEKVQMGELFQF